MIWKEWRLLLWITAIIVSFILIGPKLSVKGVMIDNIEMNSTFKDRLSPGDVIYYIATETGNPVMINSPKDFDVFKDYIGYLTVSTSKGDIVVKKDPGETIGLTVKSPRSTNLEFGLDLEGGARVIVKPKENVSIETLNQIKTTLETRINVYGLRESVITPIYGTEGGFVQIEMAGGSESELKELLEKQGKFEAKIPRSIEFVDGKGSLTFDSKHDFEYSSEGNGSLVYQDISYRQGDKIEMDNIELEVWNVSEEKAIVAAKVFTGDDIKRVHFDPQNSYLRKIGNGYEFGFVVSISTEGAERFAKVTKDIELRVDPKTGKEILESKIFFYLDDKLMDSLQIVGTLRGNPYTTPMITGGGATKEEALQSKRELQSILRSGSLPTEIEIVKSETISPKLGKDFISNAIIAGLVAIIAVCTIVYIRYRKLAFVLPMCAISLSEIILILGFASLIRWTIDMAAIAGIIAAVGTGFDSQIILIDEATTKGITYETSLKAKLKRAFFTIFGAAGTTIGAMMPLMVLGFGVLRGFAITTTIGVLAGILITRPAFGKILEKLVESD